MTGFHRHHWRVTEVHPQPGMPKLNLGPLDFRWILTIHVCTNCRTEREYVDLSVLLKLRICIAALRDPAYQDEATELMERIDPDAFWLADMLDPAYARITAAARKLYGFAGFGRTNPNCDDALDEPGDASTNNRKST